MPAPLPQDPATLDQLRVLLAIEQTGSFSAAARHLRRAQSAVSHAVAQVEAQLGEPLYVRGARRPTPTATGEAVLALAHAVCDRADGLRRLAAGLARQEEPTVRVAVDALYPATLLAAVCREFAAAWPCVALEVHTDALGAVARLVEDGTCHFGVVNAAAPRDRLHTHHLGVVELLPVVAAGHPLASEPTPLTSEQLGGVVQIVLSERRGDTPDQGVVSPRTWRVHDLWTKRALLLEGLGWGNMPRVAVQDTLVDGRLIALDVAAWPDSMAVDLFAVHRADHALGPAGAWLRDALGAALRRAC